MKFIFISLYVLFICGCSSLIGIPKEGGTQPWVSLFMTSFVLISIIPLVSMIALILSMWKTSIYQLKLQKYLNWSLVIIILLWLLGEVSIPPDTNIRIDFLIKYPAIVIQICIVLVGMFLCRGGKVTSTTH